MIEGYVLRCIFVNFLVSDFTYLKTKNSYSKLFKIGTLFSLTQLFQRQLNR